MCRQFLLSLPRNRYILLVAALAAALIPTFAAARGPDALSITSGPSGTTTSTTATFTWTVQSPVSGNSCQLDGNAPTSCDTSITYNNLATGAHSFAVHAQTKWGPRDETATWTVSPVSNPTPAPTISFIQTPPSSTTSTSATFSWSTTNATSVTCKLDSGSAGSCSSPATLSSLAAGTHTYVATATGAGGSNSTSYSWSVSAAAPPPTPAPTITFTQTPASSTSSNGATFAWSTTNATSVSCKLDTSAAAPCTSPSSLSSLAVGSHTYVATATGAGGSASATYSWTITQTWAPPTISFTQTPATSTTSTSAAFAWATTNTTSVTCKLDAGAAAPCTSPSSLASLAVGSHTYVATATGPGGTASATYTWTITASSGNVRYATPSTALSTIGQAVAGDTVVFQTGSYAKLVLAKSFTTGRVTVQCQSGASIAGVDTNGQSGYTFDSCTIALPQNSTNSSVRTVENHGPSQNITWSNCKISGGFVAFDVYGSSGAWAKNITLSDSNVYGAGGDLIHTNGVDGLRIEHNTIHDPFHDTSIANPEHHDGWQAQNTSNAQFLRNNVYWTSGAGAYTGQVANYLGQGIMLSGESGAVTNVVIANNLIQHYNGRPLNMNGSNGVQVVDNTFQDDGDGISVTFGTTLANVQVWNNIMQSAYMEGSGGVTYLDYNWFTGRLSDGYLGNMKGTVYWTGNPAFVDHTGYTLTSTSPARGKGINRSGSPTVDLDGKSRTSLVLACRI